MYQHMPLRCVFAKFLNLNPILQTDKRRKNHRFTFKHIPTWGVIISKRRVLLVDAYMVPTDTIESVNVKSASVGDVCWTRMVP